MNFLSQTLQTDYAGYARFDPGVGSLSDYWTPHLNVLCAAKITRTLLHWLNVLGPFNNGSIIL